MATRLQNIFRANVQRLLAEYGWTQTDLADAMGVTKGFVSHVMTGHRGVGLESVENFAEALGVEPASLISEHLPQKAG